MSIWIATLALAVVTVVFSRWLDIDIDAPHIFCVAFTTLETFQSRHHTEDRVLTLLQAYNEEDRDRKANSSIPQLPALSAAKSASPASHESNGSPLAASVSSNTSSGFPSANSNNATAFVSPKFELQYTCNVCETRNRVLINRMAYQKGMVVAICKGCDAKHWIADNLDPTLASKNIEELFAAGGDGDDNQRVNRVTQEVYEIERVWEFNAGEITDNEGNPVLE